MGFFQRLFGKRGASTSSVDKDVYHLYVQCGKCGAPVHTRINLRNDLSPDDEGGRIVRKTLVDDRCFRRMEAVLRFDAGDRLSEQSIEGGRMISREEFENLTQSR